jgi:hypothetical protein
MMMIKFTNIFLMKGQRKILEERKAKKKIFRLRGTNV